MPFKRNRPEELTRDSMDLAKVIADELAAPTQDSNELPSIEESCSRPGPGGVFLSVTVVWDDPRWAALSARERSRVVLKGYELARPEDAERITMALGLTRAEARKLGIEEIARIS